MAVDGVDPADVVATTVCWFLLSAVDAYWQLTAKLKPGLLAQYEVFRCAV
jgi:hypothetical protein